MKGQASSIAGYCCLEVVVILEHNNIVVMVAPSKPLGVGKLDGANYLLHLVSDVLNAGGKALAVEQS